MIQIGTVISGFKIYGICGEHCIAESIPHREIEPFVVWTIDSDGNGVHTGRYFSDRMDAEWEFASLAFPWFQDNVNINFKAETAE